ncbi:hypothetical protein AURDEDRAFT_177994 [Auricularia subglabra TFB-10046 SS5]|uniref:14-3-3 domain-containing protein n=1 Tax=Auricularia subglabra (strain TFB-10046 / SS5) TaxID=717982 RepID=J0D2Q0_AURST|nr:hypothetical protein AURDEDRAFT_177994 [Auricularia subglabra TFB-10046 SS5]
MLRAVESRDLSAPAVSGYHPASVVHHELAPVLNTSRFDSGSGWGLFLTALPRSSTAADPMPQRWSWSGGEPGFASHPCTLMLLDAALASLVTDGALPAAAAVEHSSSTPPVLDPDVARAVPRNGHVLSRLGMRRGASRTRSERGSHRGSAEAEDSGYGLPPSYRRRPVPLPASRACPLASAADYRNRRPPTKGPVAAVPRYSRHFVRVGKVWIVAHDSVPDAHDARACTRCARLDVPPIPTSPWPVPWSSLDSSTAISSGKFLHRCATQLGGLVRSRPALGCVARQPRGPTNGASDVAVTELPPTRAIHLGLALTNSLPRRCTLSASAWRSTSRSSTTKSSTRPILHVTEDHVIAECEMPLGKDPTLIMQLLRDNLSLWTSDMQDTQEGSGLDGGRFPSKSAVGIAHGPQHSTPNLPCRRSLLV